MQGKFARWPLKIKIWVADSVILSPTAADLNFGSNKEGKADVFYSWRWNCVDYRQQEGHKENMSVAFWKSSANAKP